MVYIYTIICLVIYIFIEYILYTIKYYTGTKINEIIIVCAYFCATLSSAHDIFSLAICLFRIMPVVLRAQMCCWRPIGAVGLTICKTTSSSSALCLYPGNFILYIFSDFTNTAVLENTLRVTDQIAII